MKIIKKTIYSWDEFRSVLDNEPKLDENNSELNIWSSKETTETDDWYGTKSWLEAVFILDAGGWGIPKLERTKIDGMADHIVMSATHSFMMFNPDVMDQALFFLKHSKFKREEE